MRRLVLTLCATLVLAGCGGSGSEELPADVSAPESMPSSSTETATLPGWAAPYLAKSGPEVALVYSTSDYGVGENRFGFLVVRNDGQLVQAPTAEVYVGREGSAEPVATTARLVPLGPHSHPGGAEPHDHLDATDLYVGTVDLPKPGRYWMVIQPEGKEIQGIGSLEVREQTITPPVGSKAIPSDNPTLADAPAPEITTASPPDTELLRYSIADSLQARKPFVVVFATPKFCQSRTCGPTVEVVQKVEKEIGPAVRFIHVEIYKDNDPQKGTNRWVNEWRLPTEPWVFLVDANGVIRAKFEGSVSVDELAAAVRNDLL